MVSFARHISCALSPPPLSPDSPTLALHEMDLIPLHDALSPFDFVFFWRVPNGHLNLQLANWDTQQITASFTPYRVSRPASQALASRGSR